MADVFAETVAAAVRGDADAFDTLFARNLPALKAFLRVRVGAALRAKESIDDLAQSVCREVLADIDGFEYRGDEAFRKWLFIQAARKILDKNRFYGRSRRDAAREAGGLSESDIGELLDAYATLGTPSRHAVAREELQRIEAALEDLPEPQRTAVVMSRVLGLGYAEIGERIERSEDAVRRLVHRGLARLSARIGKSAGEA